MLDKPPRSVVLLRLSYIRLTMKKKPEIESDWLNTSEVAMMIGMNGRTVTRWVIAGKFPGARKVTPRKINSAYIIPRSSVEAYLKKQRAQSSGEDDRAR